MMDPDTDFPQATVGTIISWECDLYVPSVSRLLAQSGQGTQVLQLLRAAATVGESASGVTLPPGLNQQGIEALIELLQNVGGRFVVIGEDDEDEDTNWVVGGPITSEHIRTPDIDSRALIVGKVTAIVREKRWRQICLSANPGLLSRAERREREETPPPEGKEDELIGGPALVLDILAIYR